MIHLQEKVKYYDIATEKRAEFETAMIEYNKKKVCIAPVFFLHNLFCSLYFLYEIMIIFYILLFVLFFHQESGEIFENSDSE
jgi:hypothetical protein